MAILLIIFSAIIIFLVLDVIASFFALKKVKKAINFVPAERVKGQLVSVIIPAFNEQDYLPQLIKALHNQSYENIEIIISDNASTDKTAEVAKSMGARVIRVEEKNLSLVRNKGAEIANGEILFFLDSDSLPENYYVEKMVKELKGRVVLAHGGVCCYDSLAHGSYWTLNRWFKPRFYISGRNGVCIWKKSFWQVNGYSINVNPMEGGREDLDLGWKVFKKFGFFAIKSKPRVLIGSSARREKVFGYPILDFPSAWGKKNQSIRGVRKEKIVS
jgi:glycosyltransferase involved in cell wall biosynthesis